MLLPELEADRAADVDELGLAERAMQPSPEIVAGAIRVVRDRVGPLESGPLSFAEPREVHDLGVVRQVPVAELFDPLIDDASLEDVLAYVAPAREGSGHKAPDLVGRRPEPPHYGSDRARARPAPGWAGSSP